MYVYLWYRTPCGASSLLQEAFLIPCLGGEVPTPQSESDPVFFNRGGIFSFSYRLQGMLFVCPTLLLAYGRRLPAGLRWVMI